MKSFGPIQRERKANESWQVIYMDLMTMIMVFFVILWSLNQGKDVGVSETMGDTTARLIQLPGDVLFPPGKTKMTSDGKKVFSELFLDEEGSVLNFKTSPLVKRLLVVHGHTDGDGKKEDNLILGFERAYSAYQEIRQYNNELSDHVVICSHADNSPEQEIPKLKGALTKTQKTALRSAKAKNRRITIEDKIVNRIKDVK